MGLLNVGTSLSWEEVKKLSSYVRDRGIMQFINIYKNAKNREPDELKWGDEIEYILVKFNKNEQKVQVLLKSSELLQKLNERKLNESKNEF